MKTGLQTVILTGLLLLSRHQTAAAPPLELKWSELSPVIAGHRVEVTFTDATRIRGEAVVVRDDAIVMGKGTPAPRNLVSTIKLHRTRGAWGRSIGTVLGVMTGVVVGGVVTYVYTDSNTTGVPLFLGIASGTTVAGYYVGRGLDRRTTVIKIVP